MGVGGVYFLFGGGCDRGWGGVLIGCDTSSYLLIYLCTYLQRYWLMKEVLF